MLLMDTLATRRVSSAVAVASAPAVRFCLFTIPNIGRLLTFCASVTSPAPASLVVSERSISLALNPARLVTPAKSAGEALATT